MARVNETGTDKLNEAWAIIRPIVGKEGLVKHIAELNKWDVYRPQLLLQRKRRLQDVLASRPLHPGYTFIRPPVGQRGAIYDLPYCIGVLPRVVFDPVISSIRAYEEEDASVEQAIYLRRVRKISVPAVARSFSELAQAMNGRPENASVDKKQVDTVFQRIIYETVGLSARIEDYLSTDHSADAQCGSVRKQWHFRK